MGVGKWIFVSACAICMLSCSTTRVLQDGEFRLAKNKRGKPGGVSIGEKSPLLFDARPQFLQEKVACESAAQGSLFAGRTAARLFQSLIRYVERPLRTASGDAPAFVRSCPGLLPGGAAMRPAQESNPEHELVR